MAAWRAAARRGPSPLPPTIDTRRSIANDGRGFDRLTAAWLRRRVSASSSEPARNPRREVEGAMVRKWSLLMPLACMVLLLGLDTGTADETFRIHRTGPRCKDDPACHNRFHPAIPPVMTVRPGDTVFMETRDAFDGQITRTSMERDVIPTFAGGPLDLNLVHPLTGPVAIEGAEPGDLLEVHIVDIIPDTFAYTVNVPGFGFLRNRSEEHTSELQSLAYLVCRLLLEKKKNT